jgi:hypothetical protein
VSTIEMRRFGWIAASGVAILGLLALIGWVIREPPVAGTQRDSKRRADVPRSANSEAPKRPADVRPALVEARRSPRSLEPDERRRRAEVRAQILAAQRARETAVEPDAVPHPVPSGEPERPPGTLNKRIEGHDELVAELNRDFMPLADECIEEALARDPELAGMLAIGFEFITDEDLGTVVETVDFPVEQNQVVQAELQECVRETLLSTLLPAGGQSGREALMLTLEVGADEDDR